MNILFQSLSPSLRLFPSFTSLPAPFPLVSSLALNPLYADSVLHTVHTPPHLRLHLETTRSDPFLVMRRTTPSSSPLIRPMYPRGLGEAPNSKRANLNTAGPETMGTSTDHTGCEQMVEQPRDMRSGKGCSFFSRLRTTHETTAGANYYIIRVILIITAYNALPSTFRRVCKFIEAIFKCLADIAISLRNKI